MTASNSADLVQSVERVIRTLSQTYDDIGITPHEKDLRTSNVYKALQDCLKEQLSATNKEKEHLVEECTSLISSIRQMQKSIDDYADDQSLRITLPLIKCRQDLREKMKLTKKLHAERYEQIQDLAGALKKYADALEPSFLKIELPPDEVSKAVGFTLTQSYMNALDGEFSRVYEEHQRRSRRVQEVAMEIVQLWAELGTHSLQTDRKILQFYKESPDQLGLRGEDMRNLQIRLRHLRDEKESRERRIRELTENIIPLWDKLGYDPEYRSQFLATHRGISQKTIIELEQEYEHLMQLKKENMHIFVEDARQTLQRLWDDLYYSEDEMLEFTAAFTDEYTDSLLAVHEAEIAHLEALLEERAPILAMVDKHKSLLADREQLAISSTDASRLMSRGGTGAARDPTRLLREERMRKRIAKELPKVESELRPALEAWEEENGRPFTVKGEDYLETLVTNTRPSRSTSKVTGPMQPVSKRSTTPGPRPQTRQHRSQSVKEAKSISRPNLKHSVSAASAGQTTGPVAGSSSKPAGNLRPKTPVSSLPKRPQTSHSNRPKTPTARTTNPGYATIKTPSRGTRPALTNLTHEPPTSRELATGHNSSSNNRESNSSNGSQGYKSAGSVRRKLPPAPPSKINRAVTTPTPAPGMRTRPGSYTDNGSRTSCEGSIDSSVRCSSPNEPDTPRSFHNGAYLRHGVSSYRQQDDDKNNRPGSPKLHPRAFSGTSSDSSITAVSSENWETYDDSGEEDETVYYQKLRNAMGMGDGPGSPGYPYRYGAQGGNTISIVGVDVWEEH